MTPGPAVFTNNEDASFTVTAPTVAGDLTGDGRVDLSDFDRLAGCLAGPNILDPPAPCMPVDFIAADFEEDLDLDLRDAANFFAFFGAGVE